VASLIFLIALAFISFVSACYRYVHGKRSFLAPFYVPAMPGLIYKAFRKYQHLHSSSHNSATCWVCQREAESEGRVAAPEQPVPGPAVPSPSPTPTLPRAVTAVSTAIRNDLQGRYLAARITLDPDQALLASLGVSMGTQDYQAVERFLKGQGSKEAARSGRQLHDRLLAALEAGDPHALAAAVTPWDQPAEDHL
jgi:hypothetical protein